MGLFGSKKDKQMDSIISQIRVDLSNNYKDSAKENVALLEQILEMKKTEGKMKNLDSYYRQLEELKEDIANFKRTY
ncbi:MAG: hypothetical protein J5684_01270 [Eubacterium sp.]|nr:hypothetical protein [Eubacterium sp.]